MRRLQRTRRKERDMRRIQLRAHKVQRPTQPRSRHAHRLHERAQALRRR